MWSGPGRIVLSLTIAATGAASAGAAIAGPVHQSSQVSPAIVTCHPAIDAPPVNHVPSLQSIPEDVVGGLVFKQANGNAISVTDPNAFFIPVTVSLNVAHGKLTLGGTNVLRFANNNSTHPSLTGLLSQVNAALVGLTYQPNPNFNGDDPLTITSNDNVVRLFGGACTDSDQIPISVASVNDPPVAVNDDYSFTAHSINVIGEPYGFLANDTDADGNALTWELVTQPTYGHIGPSPYSFGGFEFDADPSFVGTDSFTYRAFDGTAHSNVATVVLHLASP